MESAATDTEKEMAKKMMPMISAQMEENKKILPLSIKAFKRVKDEDFVEFVQTIYKIFVKLSGVFVDPSRVNEFRTRILFAKNPFQAAKDILETLNEKDTKEQKK